MENKAIVKTRTSYGYGIAVDGWTKISLERAIYLIKIGYDKKEFDLSTIKKS